MTKRADYNNQHKYLDPSAMNIPISIDWTKWLLRLGGENLTITATWTIPSPLTGTPEVIQTLGPTGETLTYAVANLDVNDAPAGVYVCECHVVANNAEATEDSRRLWIHVENQ